MTSTLIKHARVVNEGQVIETDVRIEGQRISKIANEITATKHDMIVDAQGCYLDSVSRRRQSNGSYGLFRD